MNQDLPPDLTYNDADQELQDILARMQSGEMGIDELTVQLQRAGTLLDFCQAKLQRTEAEVQAVLQRLGLDESS